MSILFLRCRHLTDEAKGLMCMASASIKARELNQHPMKRTFYKPLYFLLLFTVCKSTWAQSTPAASKLIEEAELRACLTLEAEGLQRFQALEARANELRGVDQLLKTRREALSKTRESMNTKKPSAQQVEKFNSDVELFNQQTDQLNADKAAFEADKSTYEQWLGSTLKPACKRLEGKEVLTVTAFYACGHHQPKELLDVPYCRNLANLTALKACVNQAGSKQAAEAGCKHF